MASYHPLSSVFRHTHTHRKKEDKQTNKQKEKRRRIVCFSRRPFQQKQYSGTYSARSVNLPFVCIWKWVHAFVIHKANVECGAILCMCAYVVHTHKMILYVRGASKIGFNYKPVHTHTHARTIALYRCKYVRSLLLTRTYKYIQELGYGLVSVCFDPSNTRESLSFSIFLRFFFICRRSFFCAPLFELFSHLNIHIQHIYSSKHFWARWDIALILFARVNGENSNTQLYFNFSVACAWTRYFSKDKKKRTATTANKSI